MAWRYLLCFTALVEGLELAQYYSSSGFSCPLAGSGEDSDATVEVSQQWPTGEEIVPRCLLQEDAVDSTASLAPQILDFYPKVGIAGETFLVEIFGRRFPHILPQENNSVVECTLGGDGYRSPAVLLSDKRALCNITSPVATSSKLGLIFANVLQAYAKKKITFGRVAAPTLQVTTVLAEDTSEECKDTQVFCQPPPPEPALDTVPPQRSFDPQPVSTTSTTDDVDNLYSIWEVVSVVPDALPLNDSAYIITFSVPPENGLACRLFPDGQQVFASKLTNYSISCPVAIGAPGSYALQIAEAPDFNFLTLPLMIEVFAQPSILHLSPVQVYPGQGWTLYLLATKFPEQRMAVASFRCKVGELLVPGEVSTSRVASCSLTSEDVTQIGPGRVAVEVLIDGLHESRSEPRIFLEVMPEMVQVDTLSGDSMVPLPRGQPLVVTGRRLPVDAGCIFGEDIPSEGLKAAFSAASFHNESSISCTVPQEASLGVQRFRLAAAGQELLVQTTSKMSLILTDRAEHQDIQEDSACAGATCGISRRYLPEADFYRMTGLDGWPGGYSQLLPSLLPDLHSSIRFAPMSAFAEQVPLRFGGTGLLDYGRLFPQNFFCEVETLRFAARLVREERWPFLCQVDLSSYKGLQVRVQLIFSNAGIEERIGPAFDLQLLLRPRVLEVSPKQALLGIATPLSLDLAVPVPQGAMLRCDFGRQGSAVATAIGRSVHCRAPTLDAAARSTLQLQLVLEETEVNITQRILIMAQEDFRFEAPPTDPVIEALPPFSAPVGDYVFLEWKSHAPIFEVLARVPYHCSWRGTEIGDLSTPLMALSPSFGRCRVPVASLPHSAAVRLEDPGGQVVLDGPLFSYYSPVLDVWWFQEDEPTAAPSMESSDRIEDLLGNVPAPAPDVGPPAFDPELLPMGLGVVPLETLEATAMLIVVKDGETVTETASSNWQPLRAPNPKHSQVPSLVSMGTVGHPVSCGTPCRYVKRKGGCRDGSACLNCHLCFWVRHQEEQQVARRAQANKKPISFLGTVGHPISCSEPCLLAWSEGGCPAGSSCRRCHRCTPGALGALPAPRVQACPAAASHPAASHPAASHPAASHPAASHQGQAGAATQRRGSVGTYTGRFQEGETLQAAGPGHAIRVFSVGSFGHPLTCAEACKYARKPKGCKDGRFCTRCHICHWHRHPPPTQLPSTRWEGVIHETL